MEVAFSFQWVNDMTQYVCIHTAALSYFNSLENLKTNFLLALAVYQ